MAELGTIVSTTEIPTYANIDPTGLTSGDALVTADGVKFVPGKIVTKTWGVGTNLSVTGTANITGAVSLRSTLSVEGVISATGGITSSGNVLIKGINGSSILIIQAAPTTEHQQEWKSNSGVRISCVNAAGSFGINTISPQGKLHIFNDDSLQGGLILGGTSSPGIQFYNNSVGSYGFFGVAFTSGSWGVNTAPNDMSFGAQRGGHVHLATGPSASNPLTRVIVKNTGELVVNNFRNNSASTIHLTINSSVGQTADNLNILNFNDTLVASVGSSGSALFRPLDSVTTLTTALTLGHSITGTPAVGFGGKQALQLKSSTTADRNACGLTWEWEVATEASQIGLGKLTAYYITTERECMQWGATSSAAKIGFLGTASVVKQASGENLTNNVTAGGTDGIIDDYSSLLVYATDAAAIRNNIYQLARKLKQVNDALRLYGLLT